MGNTNQLSQRETEKRKNRSPEISRPRHKVFVVVMHFKVLLLALCALVRYGACADETPCDHPEKKPEARKYLCKEVDELKKMLTQQTTAMTAQATTIGTRLDQADAKLKELQDQGTKLTDMMATSQQKLAEQGDALLGQEDKLSERITQQGTTLTDKMTAQETKLAEIEGKETTLAEEITAQDKKIDAIEQEGQKLVDTLTDQEKKLTTELEEQGNKLKEELSQPDDKL